MGKGLLQRSEKPSSREWSKGAAGKIMLLREIGRPRSHHATGARNMVAEDDGLIKNTSIT